MKRYLRIISKRKFAYIFIAPSIIFFLVLTVYPLIYSLRSSFFRVSLLRLSLGQVFVGLENYIKIFRDFVFWNSFRITAIFGVGTVILQFILGFGIALLLNSIAKWKDFVRTIILLPLLITPIVIGLAWKWLLNPEVGIINYLIRLITGSFAGSLLGDPTMALILVIMVDVWFLTPFVAIVILAGLQSLSPELYEAAKIDGSTWFQSFKYITVPLLKPVLLVVLLLRSVDTLKSFDIIFALTKGGPGRATEILQMLVYRTSFRDFEIGYGAALSYIIILLSVIIAIFFVRKMSRVEVD